MIKIVDNGPYDIGYPLKIWIARYMNVEDIFPKFMNDQDRKKMKVNSCFINNIRIDANDIIFEKINENKTNVLVILLEAKMSKILNNRKDGALYFSFGGNKWFFSDDGIMTLCFSEP